MHNHQIPEIQGHFSNFIRVRCSVERPVFSPSPCSIITIFLSLGQACLGLPYSSLRPYTSTPYKEIEGLDFFSGLNAIYSQTKPLIFRLDIHSTMQGKYLV